jgi:hypothetical protein
MKYDGYLVVEMTNNMHWLYHSFILYTDSYMFQLDQPRGQSFWLLIMRSRVRFPVLTWGFFLEGEDSYGDRGLGSLVELRFKAPPGTSY